MKKYFILIIICISQISIAQNLKNPYHNYNGEVVPFYENVVSELIHDYYKTIANPNFSDGEYLVHLKFHHWFNNVTLYPKTNTCLAFHPKSK